MIKFCFSTQKYIRNFSIFKNIFLFLFIVFYEQYNERNLKYFFYLLKKLELELNHSAIKILI